VTNGEFSFVRDDGVGFSGRIVAVSDATGTIRPGSCESNAWHGRKQAEASIRTAEYTPLMARDKDLEDEVSTRGQG
jgi:hypothetical protein